MKNTKNAAIYGVVGGALGYSIAHFAKSSKNWKIGLVVTGIVIGAVVGNKS